MQSPGRGPACNTADHAETLDQLKGLFALIPDEVQTSKGLRKIQAAVKVMGKAPARAALNKIAGRVWEVAEARAPETWDVLDLKVGAQRLSVASAGCAPAFSDHSAVVASANSISITRFRCGGSIFPQRRMPTMIGRSSASA